MKKLLKTIATYIFFSAFYVSLWTTFIFGANEYVDRFHNVMVGLYACLDAILMLVVLVVFVLAKGFKLSKFRNSEIDESSIQIKAILKEALDHYNKWYHVLYRFVGFYAAMFCAGILLGYTYMFVFMLMDAVLFKMLYVLLKELTENLESPENGSN